MTHEKMTSIENELARLHDSIAGTQDSVQRNRLICLIEDLHRLAFPKPLSIPIGCTEISPGAYVSQSPASLLNRRVSDNG